MAVPMMAAIARETRISTMDKPDSDGSMALLSRWMVVKWRIMVATMLAVADCWVMPGMNY